MEKDFSKRQLIFVNRELSWLQFNKRVLFEAYDKNVPLLERLKFISIYFSNLDEFFMVRVGSLTDESEINPDKTDDKTGWNSKEQLSHIFENVRKLSPLAEDIYHKVVEELKEYNIEIIKFNNLKKSDFFIIERYFNEDIKPLLSPQIIDRSHPFPFLKNKESYITIIFETKNNNVKFGIIPISHLPQYFVFNIDNTQKVVFTADIVYYFAGQLYSKYTIEEISIMRVTRNADISVDEAILDYDTDIDFRGVMETLLKKRRHLAAVRVQFSDLPSPKMEKYICNKLEINKEQVYVQNMPLDFSFGFSIENKLGKDKDIKKLLFNKHKPIKVVEFQKGQALKYLENRELLINFPFQSIKPFIDILYDAADDSSVISIKISLYRLSNNSKIVSALAYAAERGKNVLCILELRARFDEQNNIDYSKVLEDAGCTVIYGLSDYKIHAKICLITKKHHNTISYITQIGTGNYNEKTSEQYTDISYITSDYDIGNDANNVFNAICLGEVVDNTKSLWVAPNCYISNAIKMIENEIEYQKKDGSGFIAIKVNSMNDITFMEKLIEASCSGVKIELYIRGICCLRPKIKGFTENITIKSIVGRYLEHSRIFCFGKGNRCRVFIGSGDILNRNTKRRIEVFAEVKNDIKNDIIKILEACRMDNQKSWTMLTSGDYKKFNNTSDKGINCQEYLKEYFSKTVISKRKSFIENIFYKIKSIFNIKIN